MIGCCGSCDRENVPVALVWSTDGRGADLLPLPG